MKTTIATAFIAASLFVHAAQAQQAEQRPKRTVLQKSDVGATGREATMQIVEFAQGAGEVPHTHLPYEVIRAKKLYTLIYFHSAETHCIIALRCN